MKTLNRERCIMAMAASGALTALASWQVPSWNMLLSEQGAVIEKIDGTWCGHVQGMCVTSNALYFAYHNQIVKTDWHGRLLARIDVLIHTGDICAWNGRLFTAVSNSSTGYGRGRIQVFDEDLHLLKEQALPRGADGITCLDGVIYIGLGSGGTAEQPNRGNWYGKYNAETLEPLCDPFRIDHGYDSSSGVQNMTTDGTRLYVNYYCPDETADTPCFIVYDKDMNVLDAHLFGWRQGVEVVPGGKEGAVRFAYCTTANWMSSGLKPMLSVQAVVRFAELKDGQIRVIDDSAMDTALRDEVEPGAELEWTQGQTDLAGKVDIAYDADGCITNLVALPTDGERLSIAGGKMTFGCNAVVMLASTGTLAFVDAVQTTGALTLARGDGAYLVWRGEPLGETDVGHPLVFPDVMNGDVDFMSAVACGTASGRFRYVEGPSATSFYVFNRVAAGYVYSVRIQLTEKSDGLHARCRTGIRSPRLGLYPDVEDGWLLENLWQKWGKDDSNGFGLFGYSGDPSTYGGDWIGRTSAFGFKKLVARRKGMNGTAQIRFDGGVTLGGETHVEAGVDAVIAVGDGDRATRFSHPFMGDGDVTIRPLADPVAYGGVSSLDDFIATNAWKTLAANRSLSALTAVKGYMQGRSHNATNSPSTCGTFHYRYDAGADTATCQFQFKRNPGVKYVKAKLRQNGNDVEIAAVGAGFYEDATYGTDFSDWTDNTPVSTFVNPKLGFIAGNLSVGYGIRMLSATFSAERSHAFATLNNCMSNMVGCALSFVGGDRPLCVSVTSNAAFTAYGEVSVGSNATVLCMAPGQTVGAGLSGGGGTLTVQCGGTLRSMKNGQIGSAQRVVVDGGVLSSEGGSYYLNDLTLMNGGRLLSAAHPPRVSAFGSSQLIRAVGAGTFPIEGGVRVFGVTNASAALGKNYACRIEVTDFEGCCRLGKIHLDEQNRAQYLFFPLEKYGAGSLYLMEDALNIRMATRVFGGMVRLCASGIATNDVLLAGGAFAAADGTANELGALSVDSRGGVLELGVGAALSFADSSAQVWEGPVTVVGFRRKAIRFGTSRTGLTVAQCALMRTSTGRSLILDDFGYLTVRGLSISVQ